MGQERPGRLWLQAGGWGLIVTAALHVMGHFSGGQGTPEEGRMLAAMSEFSIAMPLGMRPTGLMILNSLSLGFSILLLGLGGVAVGLGRTRGLPGAVDRQIAGWLALVVTGLTALFAYYQVLPPMVTLGVVAILLVVAWWRSRS